MTRQAAFVAILLSGLVASAAAAAAQSVPLPPPAPQPKQRTVPSMGLQPNRPMTPAPGAQAQEGVPSWLPPIFGGKPATATPSRPGATGTTAFDPAQRALADKVSAYLTGVQVLSGDFVQQGPDGRQAKGQFYIQKPGRVRFEYEPPSPIEIVADGSSVVVRDRKLNTQDPYPLSQTPLRFLLADRIDLLRDTNVIGVYADQIFVTVVIEEKQPLVGTNRLMLMFDAKDLKLKQWTITDAQGYDTTVAVSNLDTSRRPDPGMFRIDYTKYPN